MKKLSVIIPVYQVERYIEQCLDSVISQTYQNMEIIIVDDGSFDKSPGICDMYAAEDERIKVIHKENGGLSDARNAGINEATGDYIAFLDGDDYWDDINAVYNLMKRADLTAPDVLNYSYKKYYEDTNEVIPYFDHFDPMPVSLSSYAEQLEYLTGKNLYIASACNKLIKRALFDDELKFRKGVYSEDIEWCLRLLLKAHSMDFICLNFYCYRQRRDSISKTINEKKCTDLSNNIRRCFLICDETELNIKEYAYRYLAYQYGTFFKVQAMAENNPVVDVAELNQYEWILRYHCGNKKLFILNLLSKILGFKLTCKLIRMIYRIHL